MFALFCVVFLCVGNAFSNDIILGRTTSESQRIFAFATEAQPFLWKRTNDIVVDAPRGKVISAIYVTDLRDEKDGEAFIKNGGVGDRTVTIGLKSPTILRGYKFKIEVYADDATSRL